MMADSSSAPLARPDLDEEGWREATGGVGQA